MNKFLKVVLLSVMATIILFFTTVLGVGNWMMPVDQPAEADAIIVVSGGGDERLEKGIQLYNDGYSDIIVFSGDASDPASPSNAEVMRAKAIEEGVPASAILIEPESKTTYENAVNTKRMLEANDITHDTLILVTSSYHQRRLLQNFQHVYRKESITFINQPASVTFWAPNSWWLNDQGFTITAKEFLKVAWGAMTGNLTG